MLIASFLRFRLLLVVCAALPPVLALPQAASSRSTHAEDELAFAVVLTRHGVRSPTGNPARYAGYSGAAWPQWDVPPGYLTPHGFQLMKLFGAYDRELLASEGLLSRSGCSDADRVYVYADSDQRTRETGRALAEGMFAGCAPAVEGLPEGTRDPVFHPLRIAAAQADRSLDEPRSTAAAQKLQVEYRPQIAALDRILATCGTPASPEHQRVSLLDSPSQPSPEKQSDSADLRGPLGTAATFSENFLLEYAQGMPMRDVGWGCISRSTLNSLIGLHTAVSRSEHGTPAAARSEASNLLSRIRAAMEQAATGEAVPGAPDPPGTRALFLVGHDTNLEAVAGLLHLSWTADGRRDDTPPGSALVFELWRKRSSGQFFVRTWYMAQTLDQMRHASPLTLAHPPVGVPLIVGGCSETIGSSCSWNSLSQVVDRVIGNTLPDPSDAGRAARN